MVCSRARGCQSGWGWRGANRGLHPIFGPHTRPQVLQRVGVTKASDSSALTSTSSFLILLKDASVEFWAQPKCMVPMGIERLSLPMVSKGCTLTGTKPQNNFRANYKPDIIHASSLGIMVFGALAIAKMLRVPIGMSCPTHLPNRVGFFT
ncbi:hypothetical protein OPV22_023485 [Ensete ventricosum]|uniref:Uncharacterized protein n=1 Tax=Ensete ventricosum TaxID=4639 RepID=A0AAV8QX18_ENSVE|nr:hypothetical protein OPV22_023485 [Ensete ventricosum]